MNTKPDSDRVYVVSQVVDELTKAMANHLDRSTRTCINCVHFHQSTELCLKFNKQRPPARIIATGCDGHEDEIPF